MRDINGSTFQSKRVVVVYDKLINTENSSEPLRPLLNKNSFTELHTGQSHRWIVKTKQLVTVLLATLYRQYLKINWEFTFTIVHHDPNVNQK